ncbi:hypothetical protein KGQ27_02330 [Patescibacteria group bacterium]|nr:hypothetical protein [Patescibacteria group bacterium]MDE1946403.1 hypothetical protein [Patescibacteria group bacterium]MDE2011012.1 hypothetical protein [Patescibacteria group bacterium]MDE2233035.1 hypothetical protein [Patescibacteria group bacterium]
MSDINNNPSPEFNDPINWQSLGFFSVEDYLLYVFKKTEKITSALYLVSGLLKDDEPMKWELRDRGMDLLSSSFSASNAVPGDKNYIIQSLFTAALETISLLNVAKVSNLISEMNYSVLVKEIDQIVALMKDRLSESAQSAGLVLSEQFFKTPSLFTGGFKAATKSKNEANSHKSRQLSDVSSGHSAVEEKKAKRRDDIINVLKGQSNLTIKDFAKVIKDCSEKTIQRELIEMVEKGLIRKEGERRWSRYSLN